MRSLDATLGGGLFTGEVTEIVGQSGSGQTHMCMMAAIQAASKGLGVVYFTTAQTTAARSMFKMLKATNKNERSGGTLGTKSESNV